MTENKRRFNGSSSPMLPSTWGIYPDRVAEIRMKIIKGGFVDNSPAKLKGEHCINIFISYELKDKISRLAKRYDRTMADVTRTLIKIGIPILESLTEAEERMLLDYIQVLRRWRKVKELKTNEDTLENEGEEINK